LTIKVEKTDRKVELLESLAFKTDTTNENILMLINEVKNSQEQADTIIKELIKQNIGVSECSFGLQLYLLI